MEIQQKNGEAPFFGFLFVFLQHNPLEQVPSIQDKNRTSATKVLMKWPRKTLDRSPIVLYTVVTFKNVW
jgi:hypothetical protein